MVVGEWSLALGGRGKAALPASQVGRCPVLMVVSSIYIFASSTIPKEEEGNQIFHLFCIFVFVQHPFLHTFWYILVGFKISNIHRSSKSLGHGALWASTDEGLYGGEDINQLLALQNPPKCSKIFIHFLHISQF